MELSNNGPKKIICAVLIVFAIVFRILQFKLNYGIIAIIDTAICTIALLFGLFYTLSGYKKDAAKYYKAFVILLFISFALSLITHILLIPNVGVPFTLLSILNYIVGIGIVICLGILSFVKDMGRKKSTTLAYIILALNLLGLLVCILRKAFESISIEVSCLILAFILVVFVRAKYIDKATRGSN